MTRGEVCYWISQGYQIFLDGKPVDVNGDIWDYLDKLDNDENVFVLADLLNWSDADLLKL